MCDSDIEACDMMINLFQNASAPVEERAVFQQHREKPCSPFRLLRCFDVLWVCSMFRYLSERARWLWREQTGNVGEEELGQKPSPAGHCHACPQNGKLSTRITLILLAWPLSHLAERRARAQLRCVVSVSGGFLAALLSGAVAQSRSRLDMPPLPLHLIQLHAAKHGWKEILHNPDNKLISFTRYNAATQHTERLNAYYSTGTVGTCVDHPTKSKTQLFRRHQSIQDLAKIFDNPRVHTGTWASFMHSMHVQYASFDQ